MLATILFDATAMPIHYVHPDINVTKENVEIYVKRLIAVQELVVIQENAFAHPDTLDHQMI